MTVSLPLARHRGGGTGGGLRRKERVFRSRSFVWQSGLVAGPHARSVLRFSSRDHRPPARRVRRLGEPICVVGCSPVRGLTTASDRCCGLRSEDAFGTYGPNVYVIIYLPVDLALQQGTAYCGGPNGRTQCSPNGRRGSMTENQDQRSVYHVTAHRGAGQRSGAHGDCLRYQSTSDCPGTKFGQGPPRTVRSRSTGRIAR